MNGRTKAARVFCRPLGSVVLFASAALHGLAYQKVSPAVGASDWGSLGKPSFE
jgi:hypothetical protein